MSTQTYNPQPEIDALLRRTGDHILRFEALAIQCEAVGMAAPAADAITALVIYVGTAAGRGEYSSGALLGALDSIGISPDRNPSAIRIAMCAYMAATL